MLDQTWTLKKWHAPPPPDGVGTEKYWMVGGLSRQENIEIITLGNLGMSIKTIAEFTKLTEWQVSYRLKKFGIKVQDFRQGKGPIAALVMQRLANRVTQTSIQLVRERGAASPLLKETHTHHGR